MMNITTRVTALLLSFALFGCSSKPAAAPPARHARAEHPTVYRLDFVLSPNDGSARRFSLNLEEGRSGQVVVGKNVPLMTAGTAHSGHGVARQDVGLKVAAAFHRESADTLILDASIEISALEMEDGTAAIRKVVTNGTTLATAGKPTRVASIESDQKVYELTVTPTKLSR